MSNLDKGIIKFLDIGIALTTEKNYNSLLEYLLNEAMTITSSDAGTIYTCDKDLLHFKIMRNNTLKVYKGGKGESIDLPPVPMKKENVCAYSAITKKIVNLPNAKQSGSDFLGPSRYDKITGYNTKAMLVAPLRNHENEVLGVIQLINPKDKNGNTITYTQEAEYIISSLASQAAVSISNMKYLLEIKELLYSFVSVMATAIDERSPYNANHTINVAKLTDKFIDYLNALYKKGEYNKYFNENHKEQIVLAANLHDVGKIVTPLSIMNKSSRFGKNINEIENRFELIKAYLKIDFLENRISESVLNKEVNYINNSLETIKEIDTASYLSDKYLEFAAEISKKVYIKTDKSEISYLTDYEKECILIKKGTLTDNERKIMNNHALMTTKLLDNINFNIHYKNVPKWAGGHHEYLDGSGYPNHLKAEDIPIETRIIAIIDIFEALTSKDRPYKSQMDYKKAFSILESMVKEGKLDGDIVKLLKKSYEEQL